ncbi:MAG: hypothetical protein AAF467_26155 [Actinomycetota bacterium]
MTTGASATARSGLEAVTDEAGRLLVLALDHRDSLRVEFDAEDPDSVPFDTLVQFKVDLVTGFGARPTAVMLDPELSIDPILGAGLLPSSVGSLCALEAQGYLGDPDARTNQLLDGWSPARAGAVGASAAKLLVLYRPDRGATTDAQDDLIRQVVAGCGEAGLPLFVEPVPYDVVDHHDRERTVIASAERIAALGPDVIKMPFPGDVDHPERWASACRGLDDSIDVPWAILSWGVGHDVFVRQVEAACAQGCSGFMAGRAIWREAVHTADRRDVIARVALPRFDALVAAAAEARSVFA